MKILNPNRFPMSCMMKRYVLSVFITSICITLIVSIASANDRSIRKDLKALYARKAELSRNKDIKALIELNTPDYKLILRDGNVMNNQRLEEQLKLFFGLVDRNIRFVHEIKQVNINGNEAVVVVEQKDKRIQRCEDGKLHEVEANVIHRDTWIREANSWKLKMTEEQKQIKLTVDGKPIKS